MASILGKPKAPTPPPVEKLPEVDKGELQQNTARKNAARTGRESTMLSVLSKGKTSTKKFGG